MVQVVKSSIPAFVLLFFAYQVLLLYWSLPIKTHDANQPLVLSAIYLLIIFLMGREGRGGKFAFRNVNPICEI